MDLVDKTCRQDREVTFCLIPGPGCPDIGGGTPGPQRVGLLNTPDCVPFARGWLLRGLVGLVAAKIWQKERAMPP